MPLTDRQKRYYASAPRGEVQQVCISLFHPAFEKDHHLTLWRKNFVANVRGQSVEFEYHPFRVGLPRRNGSGQQDLEVSTFITSKYFLSELQAAAVDAASICEIEYNQYFPDDPNGQVDPIVLNGSSIAIDGSTVTFRAQRADMLNRAFPQAVFLPSEYPGLVR